MTVDLTDPANNTGEAQGDTYNSIEQIFGSDHNDTITGGAGVSTFVGLGGNDTLNGTAGNEYIDGGDGDDTLTGAGGLDTLVGGSGNDTLNGVGSMGRMDGGPDEDTADFSSGGAVTVNLTTQSASGGRTIVNIENVTGSAQADTLTGDANANKLTGNAGNDTLEGGGGADELDGGAGADTASYAGSRAGVTVDLSSTTAQSGGHAQGDTLTGIENVTGSAHADTLTGTSSANVLKGSGGNDILEGGDGGDTLNGGDGSDTASYSGASGDVTASLHNQSLNTGDAQGDTYISIENITGSAHDDTLYGNNSANVLKGASGIDNLNGFDGADTLTGGPGNDTLTAGPGDDTLNGGVGNDSLSGGAGNDEFYFYASFDNDTIADYSLADSEKIYLCMGTASNVPTHSGADSGSNHVITVTLDGATAGTITLSGITSSSPNFGNLNIVIPASSGGSCSVIRGTASNDVLRGTPDPDTIYGLGGNDELYGLGGDDLLNGGPGADELDGGDGTDTADYDGSGAGVTVDLSKTTAQSGGHAQGDTLTDIENVTGSAHDDTLTGDANANILTGGGGSDQFRFHASFGADTIRDYTLAASEDASERIYLCMGTASDQDQLTHDGGMNASNGNDLVITVTFNSATAGTITLTGITTGHANFANLNIRTFPANSDGTCMFPQLELEPEPGDLQVWFVEDTPNFVKDSSTDRDKDRIFRKIATNLKGKC